MLKEQTKKVGTSSELLYRQNIPFTMFSFLYLVACCLHLQMKHLALTLIILKTRNSDHYFI